MAPLNMDDRLHAHWESYVDAERIGVRDSIRAKLDDFVAALQAEGSDFVDQWALDVAERVADFEEPIPIRFPLVRRIIAPVLVRGVRESKHGCARWLAHFARELPHAVREMADLPERLRTGPGLLQEALRVDHSDAKARRRLVEETAQYLAYTLHELPAGVLYGHDGATVEQCDELIGCLDDFCTHVDLLGERSHYAGLIAKGEYHFRAYRDYLSSRLPGQSYAEFLTGEHGG